MNTISYLKNIYGYDTPILLKDIRIGRKSKAAIKQELYLATKRGDISREYNGVYCFKSNKEFGSGINFDMVLRKKYICDNWGIEGFEIFNTYGYYSGLTLINLIGLSEQVPAIVEITTNNTSCKKRTYSQKGTNRKAIIRKSRIDINGQNYKILQFLEMFCYLSDDEIYKGKSIIVNYIKDNKLMRLDYEKYIKYFSMNVYFKIAKWGISREFI